MKENYLLASRIIGLERAKEYPQLRIFYRIPPRKTDKDWNYYLSSIEAPIFSFKKSEYKHFKKLIREYAHYSCSEKAYVFLGKGFGFKRVLVVSFYSDLTNYHINCVFLEDFVLVCVPKPVRIKRAYTHWGSYKGTFIIIDSSNLENFNQTIDLVNQLYHLARNENISAITLKDILESTLKVLIAKIRKLIDKLGG
jgi:hypothetical protein